MFLFGRVYCPAFYGTLRLFWLVDLLFPSGCFHGSRVSGSPFGGDFLLMAKRIRLKKGFNLGSVHGLCRLSKDAKTRGHAYSPDMDFPMGSLSFSLPVDVE